MKVFISWSGERAGAFAKAFGEWLPDVLTFVEPFVSASDFDKGARWQTEIASRLDDADFGIICITRDRFGSPWLNFEAGALSRAFAGQTSGRVATLLLDIASASDVPQPLGQFQATLNDKDDLLELVRSIAKVGAEANYDDARVSRMYARAWDDLEPALTAAKTAPEGSGTTAEDTTKSPSVEKLDEVLSILRESERAATALSSFDIEGLRRILSNKDLMVFSPAHRDFNDSLASVQLPGDLIGLGVTDVIWRSLRDATVYVNYDKSISHSELSDAIIELARPYGFRVEVRKHIRGTDASRRAREFRNAQAHRQAIVNGEVDA